MEADKPRGEVYQPFCLVNPDPTCKSERELQPSHFARDLRYVVVFRYLTLFQLRHTLLNQGRSFKNTSQER
jgi:hypothetical protein